MQLAHLLLNRTRTVVSLHYLKAEDGCGLEKLRVYIQSSAIRKTTWQQGQSLDVHLFHFHYTSFDGFSFIASTWENGHGVLLRMLHWNIQSTCSNRLEYFLDSSFIENPKSVLFEFTETLFKYIFCFRMLSVFLLRKGIGVF